MNELYSLDRWLYNTLRNYAPLAALVGTRIYTEVASQDATHPLVVFGFNAGSDTITIGGESRILVRARYLVKAIARLENVAVASQVASRIDDALVAANGSVVVDGVTLQIQGCIREEMIRFREVADPQSYIHVGGIYRIFAHE